MADDNITLLKALQGGLYSPTESFAGIGAQTLASGIPLLNNPYDSPSQNFGTTLGAGLLSGLLAGYARHDAQQQNAQLMPLMTQVMNAQTPEERVALAAGNPRLSPLVQALAFQDYESNQKVKDAIRGKQVDYQYDPLIDVAKIRATMPVEMEKRGAEKLQDLGADQGVFVVGDKQLNASDLGLLSPDDQEIEQKKNLLRAEQEIRDAQYSGSKLPPKEVLDLEQSYTDKLLTGTQAREVLNINRATSNIAEAIKKDNPLAAATAIFEYAKLQDPIGTVRETDEMRVSDPGGPLGQLARLHNEIMQKGKLTPEAKKNMAELLPILQGNAFAQYNQVRDSYKQALKQYGGEPERLQYIKQAEIPAFEAVIDPVLPQMGETKEQYIARMMGK